MRNKDIISKVFYMAVWSMIFLLAAYILIKGGIVFGTEDRFKVVYELKDYLISEISIYVEKENISLMKYTLQWDDNNGDGFLEKYISQISPFQAMVMHTEYEETEDTAIVTAQLNQILLKRKLNNNILPDGQINFIYGESYYEEEETEHDAVLETIAGTASNQKLISQLVKTKNTDFLLKNFYTVDSTTSVDKSVFQVGKMLKKDFTIKKDSNKPQILIYHTHATSEAFADSRVGYQEDTVVGVGAKLAKILTEDYGYNVIHDKSPYDMVNGKVDRKKAYNAAYDNLKKTLKENPSIEVVIDIHRDGVSHKEKKLTVVNGKKTAQIMFFNGVSRTKLGSIDYLYNPILQENLAFSLQMKLEAMKKYPNLTTRNFIKGYRYNMQLRERSLLIELGNQNNTLKEALNAMEPLAQILDEVLRKD